jgi:tetratricopeptide (TPR) repeat protein
VSRKRSRVLRNKMFWRLAAVVGLLILVVPTVLIVLEQTGSETIDPTLAELLERLRQDPQDLAVLLNLGYYYFQQGDQRLQQNEIEQALEAFQTAGGYFNRALDVEPTDASARYFLGWIYYYQGDVEDDRVLVEAAVQQWQSAASLEADQPVFFLALGHGYAALDRTDEAVGAWQRVVELAPGSEYAEEAQGLIDQHGGP